MTKQEILDVLGIEPEMYSKKQINAIVNEYRSMEKYQEQDNEEHYICFKSDYGVYFGGKIYHKLNYLLACEKAL